MSDDTRCINPLPINPSLAQLQKRAKEQLRELRAGDNQSTLADAQFAIAREHGFESWAALKHQIEVLRPPGIAPFEELANRLAAAYTAGDEQAVRRINASYGSSFPTDLHDPEKLRKCLPQWYASETREEVLAVHDARQMVAHAYGFGDWPKFAASLRNEQAAVPNPESKRRFISARQPFYVIDWAELRLEARGPQRRRDWEEIFAIAAEYGIPKLRLGGITDEVMADLTEVECVRSLDISGSQALTDEGARLLARMPQLEELEIGGWHTGLTDRALEELNELKRLRSFRACWTRGITDASAEFLKDCNELETVNVMGSPSGDGWIRALAGKSKLRFLDTGRMVTDAGILALRGIPSFAMKRPEDGEVVPGLMGTAHVPNRLMIDGDFTDAGLDELRGLDGLASLSFFWHSKAFTAAGLAGLRRLPNLEVFGIDSEQCGDEAMRQIAGIPRLRQLQAQGAVAGDAGWQALGESARMLEYIWGRDCPNFTSRGFLALSRMPVLRGIGISCAQVDDDALAALPQFAALRELVSIGITDSGFRHVGACTDLESLYCMYCRDTGDEATEHLKGLHKLRNYYAGMTQITDRSLEVLATLESLEKLEFWQCMGITDQGIRKLARLPRLHTVEVWGSPSVIEQTVVPAFAEGVRVICGS